MANNKLITDAFDESTQQIHNFSSDLKLKESEQVLLNNLLEIKSRNESCIYFKENKWNFGLSKIVSEDCIHKILVNNEFKIEIIDNSCELIAKEIKSAVDLQEIENIYKKYNEFLSYYTRKSFKDDFDSAKNEISEKFKVEKNKLISKWKQIKNNYENIQKEVNTWPLYIGTYFLKATINKKDIYAPLYLKKVSIEISNSNKIYIISMGEGVELNLKLLFVLQNEYNFNFPRLRDDNSISLSKASEYTNEYLSRIITKDSNIENPFVALPRTDNISFSMEPGTVFGVFHPSGSALREKVQELIEKGELDNILSVDPLQNIEKETESKIIEREKIFRITPTDLSQEKAIIAGLNNSIIIWGPPGTGKTQTICNLIANIIANGKRALVTSQKKAALDVIADRMGSLRKYIFFGLVDKKANKEEFYKPLKAWVENITGLTYHGKTSNKYSFFSNSENKYIENAIQLNQESIKAIFVLRRLLDSNQIKFLVSKDITKLKIQNTDDRKKIINLISCFNNNNDICLLIDICKELLNKNPDQVKKILKIEDENTLNLLFIKAKKILDDQSSLEFIQIISQKIQTNLKEINKLIDELNKNSLDIQHLLQSNENFPISWKEFAEILKIERIGKIFRKYPKYIKHIHKLCSSILDASKILPIELKSIIYNVKHMDLFSKINTFLIKDVKEIIEYANVLFGWDQNEFNSFLKIKKLMDSKKIISLLISLKSMNTNITNIDEFYLLLNNKKDDDKLEILNAIFNISSLSNIAEIDDFLNDEKKLITSLKNAKFNSPNQDLIVESIFLETLKDKISLMKHDPSFITFVRNCKSGYRIPYKFISEHKETILKLFPIIISTPNQLSTIIDFSKSKYDYCIFDEASQLHLEKGLPFASVSDISIVAGDSQQMKPTNYFGFRDESTDDEAEEASESFLDYAYKKALPEFMLTKNYRSSFSDLMMFSSTEFYKGELSVIDRFDIDKDGECIEVFDVAGAWDERQNMKEACDLLNYVNNILEKYKSIIILAFNATQLQLLDELIWEKHPNIVANMENDKIKLKNLENIQGDEAEIVVASLAYDKKAKLSATYVGKSQGRHALNVAISRAKDKFVIFKSIKANEIIINNENSQSIITFKNWLEYVEKSNKDRIEEFQSKNKKLENNTNFNNFDSDFEKEVCDYLIQHLETSKALLIENQYPVGTYKIDIAIIQWDSNKKFILGIEVDGFKYHSGYKKHMADKERQMFLESRGYPIYRVTELLWNNNKSKMINELKLLINNESNL